jgi:FAD/FMN-containing dehydrogenase
MSTALASPGHLVRHDDDDWHSARAVFNTLIDQRPEAVALPADAAEVAAAVRHARAHGLRGAGPRLRPGRPPRSASSTTSRGPRSGTRR